jgi:hypothetical protein
MAALPSVDALVASWTEVGNRADDVDTIHADTVTVVAEARAADVPPAVPEDLED